MLQLPKIGQAAGIGAHAARRAIAPLRALFARPLAWMRGLSYHAVVRGYLLFAAILTIPLIVATISRPLAYWDYISVFTNFTPVAPQDEWQTLWPNLKFQFADGGSRFFPSYTALFQFLMVLFDGEYWAAYLVKWCMKVAAACLAAGLVRRAGGSREGALVGAAFLFFHPAPFELTLYMSDGLTGMLMLLVCYCALGNRPGGQYMGDLAELPPLRYAGAFGAWLLLLGMKESAVALGAVFLLFWLVQARRAKSLVMLAPFALTLAYVLYRIKTMAAGGIALSMAKVRQKFWAYIDFVDPVSVGTGPGKLLLVALFVTVLFAILHKSSRSARSPQWLFVGLGGAYFAFLLIPVTYPPWETPRYVGPIVAALSVLVGLGVSRSLGRRPAVVAALAFSFPALTAGNIYTQHLAMNKQLDEFAVVLNRLIDWQAQGYTALRMPDGYPATEPDITILRFLEFAGRRWYGLTPALPVPLDRKAQWGAPGVLATRIPPASVLAGEVPSVARADVLWMETAEKTRIGGFEYLTSFWRTVSWYLGDRIPPRYDIGTLAVDAPPTWFLYGLRATAEGAIAPLEHTVVAPAGILEDGSAVALTGTAERPQTIEHAGKGYYSLSIPLKLGPGGWQLIPHARITVKSGSVLFGFGAGMPNTATYSITQLDEGKTYMDLPMPAIVKSDGSTVLTAFLYAPKGPFRIEASGLQHITAIPVRMMRTAVRFGAFIP